MNTMSSTIDRAGRVVIPKDVRTRVGLADGGPVDIVEHGGVIEITPRRVVTRIIDDGDGPVIHRSDGDAGTPLDAETVRAVTESVRP